MGVVAGGMVMRRVVPVTVPGDGVEPSLGYVVMSLVAVVEPRVERRKIGTAPVVRHIGGRRVGEVRGGSSG